MKAVTILVFLSLCFFTHSNIVGRSLADDDQTLEDPSLSAVCIQAFSKGCDYQVYRPTSACYNKGESKKIKNQRHLKYCENCLRKKISNEVASYKMKEVPFDDCLTQEETNKKRGLNPRSPFNGDRTKLKTSLERPLRNTLPVTLDYKNYMSSVKNQGSCGCCWAFAGTAVVQAMMAIQGFIYDLSEQAALQCTSDYSTLNPPQKSGCEGGYLQDVLNFYAKVGGVPESRYPYQAIAYTGPADFPYTPGICNDTNRIMYGEGITNFYYGLTQEQIKNLLFYTGPVAVAVYANADFNSYSSGVFNGCPANASSLLNHAVLLYGWDANGNWLTKNQWGTGWGEAGYMTISHLADCGLSSYIGALNFTTRNPSVELSVDPQCKKTGVTTPCRTFQDIATNVRNYSGYLQFALFLLLTTFLL